jgi:hypothetical protein
VVVIVDKVKFAYPWTLESTQLTLKILNATSYGNFVELNVENLSWPEQRNCYGFGGAPQSKSSGFELSDEGNNAAHARLVQQQQGSEWASSEQ